LPRRIRIAARQFLELSSVERRIFAKSGMLRALRLVDETHLPAELSTDAHVLFLCHGNIY
jgi:hypothetical protein